MIASSESSDLSVFESDDEQMMSDSSIDLAENILSMAKLPDMLELSSSSDEDDTTNAVIPPVTIEPACSGRKVFDLVEQKSSPRRTRAKPLRKPRSRKVSKPTHSGKTRSIISEKNFTSHVYREFLKYPMVLINVLAAPFSWVRLPCPRL